MNIYDSGIFTTLRNFIFVQSWELLNCRNELNLFTLSQTYYNEFTRLSLVEVLKFDQRELRNL